ncbi:phosphotransferase [Caulobacter segnis]|uniref:Aminoglycoside phosphotransferase domain-containing protein n=1 Tax=Caulobacter segnis TaxID=88688 RepID=A0A2W5WXM2_9CAUL|nr:phosphotransferase [Caulobacter segnis]PZR32834.1 MAG: hypothetical protein DI526_15350 [Caulobacter segnis]
MTTATGTSTLSLALEQLRPLRETIWSAQPASYPNTLPSHTGLDAASYVLTAPDQIPLFLKLYHPGALGFDFVQASQAASQAGGLGIGPTLLAADAVLGAMLFDYRAPPWRTASGVDFDTPTLTAETARLLRRWHQSAPLDTNAPSSTDWAERIEAVFGQRLAQVMPAWGALRVWTGRIAQALAAAGQDIVPLHGEIYMSNLLIGPNGGLALVDFDHAANGEAFADLGALALDVCDFDRDYDQLVEAYAGQVRRDLVARTKLHAILEDFRWGCLMLLQHQDRQRRSVSDLLGYGRMRLSRCLVNLQAFDVATLMGDL